MQNPTLSRQLFGFTFHHHVRRQLRDHFIPHEGNQHQPHVLHHRALFLYSALLILVKVTVLASPFLLPYNLADTSAVTGENIIALTNQSRSDYNLPALTSSPKLAVAAMNKAKDMMVKGYFAHFSADGVSPWYWIQQSGYGYTFAGENLAMRFSTAEGVNSAWLASPAHRANILSKDFTELGIAVITDSFGEEGTATLVVQMFGTPASAAVVAKPETSKPPALQVVKKSTDETPITVQLPAPEIEFPLDSSFVNKSTFRVIGKGMAGDKARIYVGDKLYGETVIASTGGFEFMLPQEEALPDGSYIMYARAVSVDGEVSVKSKEIRFTIDTNAPAIYPEQFSFLPDTEQNNTYSVKVGVSADSIRTLATVGTDSIALEHQVDTLWTGKLALYNLQAGQSVPIEIFAQDIAGNETKQRLGLLNDEDVKGVFSFVSPESGSPKQPMRLLGGLVTIEDFGKFAQNFYLLFVVFLASALILKVGIRHHMHHAGSIAAAGGVMMLAMLLFIF